MTTQYTPILKLALPVTGELSGTWGDTVNDNITSMVEQAVAGLATISTWTGNSKTLTVANGTTSESRCAMLVAQTGSGGSALTGAGEIVCPASSKLYVLKNESSFAITLKTAAGTGVAVAAGNTAFLFCDGTNVNACVTTIIDGRVTGNLTVDGNATINGNTTLGNATSDTITATARFASDLVPSTDNARDLGSSGNSWKDVYIDGTAYLALVDINGGTIDGVSIGASTAATIINVDNLRLDGNTLSSTDTNGNVVIAPNGTGDVQLDADTVRVGDSGAAATLTSNGAGALTVTTGGAANLVLSTNSGTDSGTITVNNGANANIVLAPNGTGDVQLDADTVRVGDSNTDVTLTSNGTGNLNLSTNGGTNSGTIQIAQGANASISLTPNGTGTTVIKNPSINGTTTFNDGTANGVLYLNGSKVLTTGSALTFDAGASGEFALTRASSAFFKTTETGGTVTSYFGSFSGLNYIGTTTNHPVAFYVNNAEQMRLTSTGLGIGTSSPDTKLDVRGNAVIGARSGYAELALQSLRSAASARGASFRKNWDSPFDFNIYASNGASGSSAATIFYRDSVNESMRIDSSGNLGIGTSSPQAKLSVSSGGSENLEITPGNVATNGCVIQYLNRNTVTTRPDLNYYLSSGGGSHKFYTNDTERMRLDSSGNLGLGVTPSAWNGDYKAQQIGVNSAFYGRVTTTGDTGVSANSFRDSGGAWRYISSSMQAVRYEQNAGNHLWFTAPSGTAGNAISFTQAMTLDASGNLLVGTTSGSNKLVVAGSIEQTSTANTVFTNNISVVSSSADLNLNSSSANILFSAGGSERARIDSSGNLLVGTTSLIGGLSSKLSISQTSSGAWASTIQVNNGSNGSLYTNTSGTSVYTAITFRNNGTTFSECGGISVSGSSTAYNTSSDYRLKNTIAPMTGALAKVALLKPCTYKWNADGSDGEGFIAHELAEVVPQCVTGEKDAVDAEGKPIYQGIDTSFLVATLTAAIQEQQAIINSLKARLDAANL